MRWLLLMLAACGGSVPSPEPHDFDLDEAPAIAVCANLAGLGCDEGRAKNCVEVVEKVQRTRLTNLHTGCLASAESKEAARRCRSVRCD